MDYTYGINDDYLDDDDDGVMYSTKNYSSDSDDEQPFKFAPAPSKHHKKLKTEKKVNNQDEFEKEMAAELEATVKKITDSFGSSSSSSQNAKKENADEPEYYDEIYFDSDQSDSDEEGASPKQNRRKKKHRVLSNDELLYDPSMDDADQEWVDRQRWLYQPKRRFNKNKPEPLPQSDAVLSCPACFTTLCLDCQRHEIYQNQYRAMFVFNCVTDKSEILRFAVKEEKKKKKKKRVQEASNDAPSEVGARASEVDPTVGRQEEDDLFHPVLCSICTTKVGVQDNTEVYHFFNVLTSH